MLKIKTALVAALVTSSSAAVAGPGVSFSANANVSFVASTSPTVRDHRANPVPYSMPTTSTSWLMLSSSLRLWNGMDVIRLQGGQSPTKIRVQATSGRMQIDRVTLQFLDGTTQTVRVLQSISAASPMMDLDIPASYRGVDSISIIGQGDSRLAYQVFAQMGRVEQPWPRPQVANFTGSYTSVYGDVYLQQTGNRIHGVYPALNGTFHGYVQNGVAIVDWTQPGGSGRAAFTVASDGHIDGTFGSGTKSAEGEWDLFPARR